MKQNHPDLEARDRIQSSDTSASSWDNAFPPPASAVVLPTDASSPEVLIHHRWSAPHDAPLGEVYSLFCKRNVDFMALTRDGRVTGLCSRALMGFKLGSRYGFALLSRSPAHLAQVAHPMVLKRDTPMRKILDSALAREGEAFHEDVVLVDADHRFLGLIPIEALAHLQNRLVDEQLGELRRQHNAERRQNIHLFQSNHALRQTQALYKALFANNPIGIALVDTLSIVQTHNRRFAELLNLDADADANHPLASWVVERERPAFLKLFSMHDRHTPIPATHEFTLQVPARGQRLFRFNTSWICETSQICVSIDDISDQRAVEQNLRRQEKQLLLDTLVGGIAHELNNKLTPVMGYAELLGPVLNERSRVYVGYINKGVVEAAHIVRQLLQFSRPDSGRPEIVDLRQIVEESLIMLKFKIRESNARVRTTVAPEPVNVLADLAQLKQVFMNLALNAVQAMETTPDPELSVAVGRHEHSGWITIKDNGIGIPPEIMSRIFDPFFTTKGPEKGSGLGLSVSFSIVRKYNGEIAVESTPGKGACFTVRFPTTSGSVAISDPADSSIPSAVRPGGWTGRRALVVDDEDVLRKLLQEVLRSHFGCPVDSAANGVEGLAMAMQESYDLIVSDIRMPEMNGMELYARLREFKPVLASRFLFVSGHAGDQKIDEEIRLCNVPLVEKPFTMARIIEACLPFLGAARPEAAINRQIRPQAAATSKPS